MCALLDDTPLIHDENQIGILDCRETMGNDETCPSFHQATHRLLDEDFRPCIHTRGRFIENHDRRIGKNGPRNRQQLFLTLRDVRGFLVQDRIIPVRQRPDEVISVRRFGCRDDFLLGRPTFTISKVISDRTVEEPRILLRPYRTSSRSLRVTSRGYRYRQSGSFPRSTHKSAQ